MQGFYNLAFGDKDLLTGSIDDKVFSNNGDSDKVLATIVSAVYAFTDREKDAWVYATGSTPARTRLYRMGITKYIDEVKQDQGSCRQVPHPPFRRLLHKWRKKMDAISLAALPATAGTNAHVSYNCQ